MRTVVVTGSASGMGAVTTAMLEAAGQRVIGVDRHDAEVIADLGTTEGRASAIDQIRALSGGRLEGLVPFAGLAPTSGLPGSQLVSVNYFGSIDLVVGLRDLLAAGDQAAVVTISSNATTVHAGCPQELVDACLDHDESRARTIGDSVELPDVYTATKTAIARWTRRNAPLPEWGGADITVNAVAPGYIQTPMTAGMADDPQYQEILKRLPKPLGRHGLPEDIASLVVFLLGPGARFLCGSFLLDDGGVETLLRPDAWPRAFA
jgi:NAD(P)-dependent dehydrogenase (short-subunit alcohol dehydrogenase family)